MSSPPTASSAPAWVLSATWVSLALPWSLIGPPSVSRTLGAVLLAGAPAVVMLGAAPALRAGLLASGGALVMTGILLGSASNASIGTALGGSLVWVSVAAARSARSVPVRMVAALAAAVSGVLLIAPYHGPWGPRIAGLLISSAVGWALGEAMREHGRDEVPDWVVTLLLRVGIAVLVVVGAARTFLDLGEAVTGIVLAVRRFASLIMPTWPALLAGAPQGPGVGAGLALPALMPLMGGGVALLTAMRGHALTSLRPSAPRPTPSLPADVPVLIAVGLTGTLLLDQVAINWAQMFVERPVLWPSRHPEALLWGLLAIAAGRRAPRERIARRTSVMVLVLLLVVLLSEWRIDGVTLRTSSLAIPVAFVGLLALARYGPVPIAGGVAIASLPPLIIGVATGLRSIGPTFSGRRTFVPDLLPILGGQRLAGLFPHAGHLGMTAAMAALAGAILVADGRMRVHRSVTVVGLIVVMFGVTSVLLAEAKMSAIALGAAAGAALVFTRSPSGRAVTREPRSWWVAGGLMSVALVVLPFAGARLLDASALRPEVWKRSIAALSTRDWFTGLGSQPLRSDRDFHQLVETSWGASHAHNQALEMLLTAGVLGLLVYAVLLIALIASGFERARDFESWPLAAAVFIALAGIPTSNFTLYGHDVVTLLVLGLLVAVLETSSRPILLDPEALGEQTLARAWRQGRAVAIRPPGRVLPTSMSRAVAGDLPLPPGTALVVPTSGSTGEPRAVVLAHDALAVSTAASIAALGCRPGERWALALPLRHVAGLQVLARARALGTRPHVVADPGDPHAIAAAADHAEHIALVPTQLVRCLDAGGDVVASIARFRTVLVGGGPLAPERIAQARAAGIALTLSYGMTETCGGCVYDGRPLDGVTFDIDRSSDASADVEQRDPAAAGAPGRIRLRGPMLAAGYLDPSSGDAESFTDDGWFVTDDLGRIAPDGTLEVLGRVDAVINTGGVKVDPVAVQALLRADTAVADALVVGLPDAEWGERVVAVVVPTDPSAPPTLEQLRATVGAALPTSHAPRELRIVERIARDAMGKVSAAERARLSAG